MALAPSMPQRRQQPRWTLYIRMVLLAIHLGTGSQKMLGRTQVLL